MVSRLKGLSRSRVATICSAEADVSMVVVLHVMSGERVKSSQGRRVVKWCQDNGYPIDRTEPSANNAEDALAQLEAREAARQGR